MCRTFVKALVALLAPATPRPTTANRTAPFPEIARLLNQCIQACGRTLLTELTASLAPMLCGPTLSGCVRRLLARQAALIAKRSASGATCVASSRTL